MKIYRVTEICNKLEYSNLAIREAAYEGKQLHKFLANQYQKVRGMRVETTLISLLYLPTKTTFAPIAGIFQGTPDLGHYSELTQTLHVTDGKTISPSQPAEVKSGGGDQTSTYAYKIMLNYPNLVIKHIILTIKIFSRQVLPEDPATRIQHRHLETQEISARDLKAKLSAGLKSKLGNYELAPFSAGGIKC